MTAVATAPLRPSVGGPGPCMVERCGGQLEIRHERQYGKVYTVCPACERRVVTVEQLQRTIAALRHELAHPRVLTPVEQRREARKARDAEIIRRYRANEALSAIGAAFDITNRAIRYVLARHGVPRRALPRGASHADPRARGYAVKCCAKPECGAPFTPTGPRARYCPSHRPPL